MPSVFEKFGGIRPMADVLSAPPSTVKSWHEKKSIPPWRYPSIMEAAKAGGIDLDLDELENVREDDQPMRPGRKPADSAEAA